jgi:hypothetical protein
MKVEIGGFVVTKGSDGTNLAPLFGLFYLRKEPK